MKEMENYSVIGKSVPKIDGPAKVTGQAKYTGDLKFPNMLVGKILTSPHAHARILNIDTSEAEKTSRGQSGDYSQGCPKPEIWPQPGPLG